MPRVIITAGAAVGLERCRQFLSGKNPLAAKRAAQAIKQHSFALETNPELGRPVPELPDLRELVIPFGDSSYVALYRNNALASEIYLLAFRHQKEAGF